MVLTGYFLPLFVFLLLLILVVLKSELLKEIYELFSSVSLGSRLMDTDLSFSLSSLCDSLSISDELLEFS